MRVFVALFVLCFSVNIFSQNYNFGKVSKEELQEKYNSSDSSANATYLYKYRRTFFDYQQSEGFQLITEVHERIKIYNQEGFEYATKQVKLYKSGTDNEEVSSIKGYTYNLINNKIEEAKLKKDGIFKTELSKYFDETKFTMSNIKNGCIVEYKYRITSPFYSNVDEFVFQHDIPIKKIEAKFEAPEYFNFKFNAKGYLSITPEKTTKKGQLTYKNEVPINENSNLDSMVRYRIGEIEFTKDITSYNLTDIPALKEEPFVNNIDNYRSGVKYELSYTKFPNSLLKHYSTTWEDVVKTIYDSSHFGDELKKSGYYEEDIDNIISSISDPAKKVARIFDLVKSRVKWNGYYGKYTADGVKKAYYSRIGNVAEINLMLTSMLCYAGIKAYPVLVSTRTNGIPLFPTREGYNYVISYVELSGGTMLLDATNKYTVPNVLPFRTLNWQGRVIAEKGGSELIDLYPKQKSQNTIAMMVELGEDGVVEGDFRSVKTNHKALSYRNSYIDVNEDEFLEKLENKYDGMEILDFKVTNSIDFVKPVIESYKFVKENQADIIGDKIYFSPMFFLKSIENPFKLEKREFPVDFGYPSTTSYRIIINTPEGYKIETVPEPTVLGMPDNLGLFKYNIKYNETSIHLIVESQINQSIILPSYYEVLKEFFNQMITKEAEQIVLTRI